MHWEQLPWRVKSCLCETWRWKKNHLFLLNDLTETLLLMTPIWNWIELSTTAFRLVETFCSKLRFSRCISKKHWIHIFKEYIFYALEFLNVYWDENCQLWVYGTVYNYTINFILYKSIFSSCLYFQEPQFSWRETAFDIMI